MKTHIILLSLIAAILLNSYPCYAQSIKFNKVELSEEFNGAIAAITQDPKGYIWFGISSNGGLLRYDGYQIVTFKYNPENPQSLASDWVECIYADSDGILWVGTFGAGMDRFDPATGTFTHFRHDPKDPSSLGNDSVTCIMKDHAGTMWVGNYMGLERFDPKTSKFTHFPHKKNDSTSLSNNEVRTIYEDKKGTLWVGTGSPWSSQPGNAGGLNSLNRQTGKFTRYLHSPNDSTSLVNNKVRAVFEDSYGTLWVGTSGDGLHTMDRSTGTFRRHLHDPAHPEKLSRPALNKNINHDQISFIKEDVSGSIWIGTVGAGMNRYNPKTKTITYFGEKDSINGLRDPESWVNFTSRDGTFWVGTFNGTIYKADLLHTDIPYYQLGHAAICLLENKQGTLWIGTDSGLIKKDKDKIEWFANDPHKQGSLSNNIVMAIQEHAKGLWIATHGGGLNYFDFATKMFRAYRHNIKDTTSLINDAIHTIVLDNDQNLWVGTDGGGIDFMTTKTGTFKHFNHDRKDSNTITCIYQDKRGRVWAGSAGDGLSQLDSETGNFKHYLGKQEILDIYQDSKGNLWVGASSGIFHFKEGSNVSSVINSFTGREFPRTFSIIEDNNQNIWFSSSVGFVKYNEERKESSIYGKNFGIDVSRLIPSSVFKNQKGEIFFGDATGYFSFLPEVISKNSRSPQILLTEFRINNKVIGPGNNSPFFEEIWKTKEISLSYDQNVFSFDLTAIDYANPLANQLLYKLENYDNDWRFTGAERKGYYFNVPPGNYILKIKASNGNGVWAEKSVSIDITPPWWRTWLAYSMLAIVLVAGIWGFIYYRSKSLLREKKILENKVTLRTAEVLKQKEEIAEQRDNLEQTLSNLKNTQAQLVQREKMASLGELTAGIAHEIQNPLNFVNNFSEVNTELLEELEQEANKGNIDEVKTIANDLKENEQKINYHGKRADAIVKGMLQHSRTSTAKKEPTDINALADEYLRLSYHGLRAKNKDFNATIKTDFDEAIGKVNIIPQDIGRVLLNLYNNAFYAVAEKKKQQLEDYEPTVSVSTKRSIPSGDGRGEVIIRVKDNGNGIPSNIIDKIFQPFFTTKPTGQGTGLGLSLSYDIIKAHSGEMRVQSREGEGTEFIFKLPIMPI